ncbi:MAG: hypothetical protein CMJ18_10090 [Phycisphaeraceae bacterium]|nr:hypothetical protein [Phycisphaeraceae bacterium]
MRRIAWALAALAGGVLVIVMLIGFQGAAPAREARLRVALSGDVDFDRLFEQITIDRVRRTHDRITEHSSRLAGSPGDVEAARFIEQELRKLEGMEVFDQSFPVTIPVTKHCRLALEDGGDAGDVSLAPFWPNLVRTCTTPPDGLVGELIDGGTGRLEDLDGKAVEGRIVLLEMTRGPDWLAAAKLGARAIVFRASDDPWHYGHKVLKFPADIPRFLADGPVDRLIGRRVRITARIDWERRTARNVYGVLRPWKPSHEALVLMGFTDTWSVVPDQAPGHFEACSATALLESARALWAQREGLSRTTIFVACSGIGRAAAGPRRLMDAMGQRIDFAGNRALLARRLEEAERAEAAVQRAGEVGRRGDYWDLGAAEESRLWSEAGDDAEKALTSIVQRVIDRYIGEVDEHAAAARLAWVAAERPGAGPRFDRLADANRRLRRARSAAGADGAKLKRFFPDVLDASDSRTRLGTELTRSEAYARRQSRVHRDTVRVADLFAPFEHTYLFVLAPAPAGRRLTYQGDGAVVRALGPGRDAVVARWLQWWNRPADPSAVTRQLANVQGHGGTWTYTGRNRVFPVEKVQKSTLHQIQATFHGMMQASILLAGARPPDEYQTPLDRETNLADLAAQTQLLTGLAAQVLSGSPAMLHAGGAAAHQRRWFSDFGGRVVTVGGPSAILPDRRVADVVVVVKDMLGRYLFVERTVDGTFRFPAVERGPDTLFADAYAIDGPTGAITAARDMGDDGQRQPYKVSEVEHYREPETRVTLVLKRMSPLDLFQLVGPNDQPVVLEMLDARTRAPLKAFSVTHDWEHGATVFAPRGERFFLRQRNYPHYRYYGFSISNYHRLGQQTKGVLMGEGGAGYLAGANRRVIFHEADAAGNGARLNDRRLAGQLRAGLGDPVSIELADKARRRLESGRAALRERRYTQAYRDLAASNAASMRIYPRVRSTVADAVNGILLYLFLLVPFSLFAERLLIGCGDLKARIIATFGFFLAGFLLIRATHPVYELVSSGLIVLVGFVILMLCGLILVFIVGKFAERIADLRRAGTGRSTADGGQVSPPAAASVAFALGLNNMRKRKMRTGSTVAALVLVSFCLVCFTAPRPQWLGRQIALGPSGFEGVMFRYDRQSAGHLASVRARYGDRAHLVARRSAARYWDIYHTPPGGAARKVTVRGALYVQPDEALVSGLDRMLLPGGRWLRSDHEDVCYISDASAATLGIDPASVGREPVEVLLSGWRVRVAGVFDGAGLEKLRDLDGEPLLPEYWYKSRQRAAQRTRDLAGRPTGRDVSSLRVPASDMVILPLDAEEGGLVSSVALRFDRLPFAARRRLIDEIMDGSPTFISYALDGLAWFGGRFPFAGLDLLLDIVLPLAIGSLIVFTTMLGSVYERQKEISIYSAVGLAPRHVLLLFLAEGLVYAVIGLVGGYLLALVLQWLSHRTGGALGLNIDYSSRSAIYVTLTLMAAVIVSSLPPAWRAARIASPSDRVSWSLPAAAPPGHLAFPLPFTYVGRDALAIVPFLTGWFDERGEDASGEFAASPPRVDVSWPDPRRPAPVVTVTATTSLRPYDLGVSQEVRLSIAPSGAGMHVISIELDRLSGDENSWRRTNVRFVGLLRTHLLSWRAVSRRRKGQMWEQAVEMMTARSGS